MSAAGAHLTLRPGRCNQCGACVSACPSDAIRVGGDYILVDWHVCNHCCGCVEACDRGAIQRALMPLRPKAVATVAPADVTKVVVGSRAEAKAVRKAAEKAAKQTARATARPAPAAPRSQAARDVSPVGDAVVAMRGRTRSADAAAMPAPAKAAQGIARAAGATWTLADAFVVLAVLLVTLVGKNAVLALPAVALMPAAGRAFTRAGVLATYYAVQIGALVLLAGRHGVTFRSAFGLWGARGEGSQSQSADRPSASVSAWLTVALLVGVEVVAIGYGLSAQALGWKQPVTLSADVSTVFGGGGIGILLSVLLVAVIAPVAEELAFRGVILPAAADRWGAWPAIAISASLFAAYHVSAWLFVPMLTLGAALGWLTVTRRSLWPAIALHVLYNSLAVAAAFFVPR